MLWGNCKDAASINGCYVKLSDLNQFFKDEFPSPNLHIDSFTTSRQGYFFFCELEFFFPSKFFNATLKCALKTS